MKWLVASIVVLSCACSEHGSSVPSQPFPCGSELCQPGQLCATITAGHTCDTNPDAGLGEYAVLRQYCMDVPATCGADPSCDCIAGCSLATGEGRPCLNVFDQSVSCGCF